MAVLADKIEHVIVLMLENRSFDHLLGFVPGVGELTGQESNPDGAGGQVRVSSDAEPALRVGPDHSHDGVIKQIGNQNQGFVVNFKATVEAARRKDPTIPLGLERSIMRGFDPTQVPVLSMLAREFVVLRRWYASVPGETWPNRNYAHAATSHGQVDIVVKPYTDKTIFEVLSKAERSWRIYHEGPAQTWAFPKLWLPFWRHHFKGTDKLLTAIDHDQLDTYSFVEPDHGMLPFDKTSNNQHPDNNTATKEPGRDFKAAELLISSLYERLRAKPSVFTKTLLLVTYDEHGGFYDHVSPPQATPPDKHIWKKGAKVFRFDRLGVRVPAILVSPWLDPAVIDDDFDHSAIVATLRRMFAPERPPLTNRDRASRTFEALPVRAAARTLLPATSPLPLVPLAQHKMALKAAGPAHHDGPPRLDDFQSSLVGLARAVDRQLDAEAKASARKARTVGRRRFAAPKQTIARFRTHQELATYLGYVTDRFHRSIDSNALQLTRGDGTYLEWPDREAIRRAFADRSGPRPVSLRNAHDLVVVVDETGALERIDLETGVRQPVPSPRVKDTMAVAASSADLAGRALAALGVSAVAPRRAGKKRKKGR